MHASAGTLASELANLDWLTKDDIRVSRSSPSAEGELTWKVTFVSGWGDVPALQAVVDGVAGTGAAVRVATVANGVAPVKGSVSVVVSGVQGQVRQAHVPSFSESSIAARSGVVLRGRCAYNILRFKDLVEYHILYRRQTSNVKNSRFLAVDRDWL